MTTLSEQVTATVTVRYFAAASAAAMVDEEIVGVDQPATVRSVLDRCIANRGPELATVLTRCSFLLDEIAVHDLDAAVPPGAAIDVLPPFAGG